MFRMRPQNWKMAQPFSKKKIQRGKKMTKTYPDDADYNTKLLEEFRCVRCVLERILRVMDEGLFVDYQLEKYSGQEQNIPLTEEVLRFLLKQGKNYPEIKEVLKKSKSVICTKVKKYGLDKEFNIKAGAKKGVIPKNLASLHIKGEMNPNWKGDNVSYSSLHTWVRNSLGKPKKCSHCPATTNLDWANKSGNYKRDVKDWISLCRKCHIWYDKKKKVKKK